MFIDLPNLVSCLRDNGRIPLLTDPQALEKMWQAKVVTGLDICASIIGTFGRG